MNQSQLYRFQSAGPEFRKIFHKKLWKGLDDEFREVTVCSTHGLAAEARFRSLRPNI